MLLSCFLKGIVLAFYIVVPIGAISVLYIKRTLENGISSGIFSALGVSTAEAFYAATAIYGLTFISDFLLLHKLFLQLCGTVFLVFIGAKTFFSDPVKVTSIKKQNLLMDYLSMLSLTLVNPLTIFGFITIFTAFGANEFKGIESSICLLLGFVFMSFSYCLLLIFIADVLKKKFMSNEIELLRMLNHISGLVIIVFTLLAFAMALVRY